jgi:biotin transport system substrate-specific component
MKTQSMAFSTRDMVFTALFAAALCVVAPFSIAIGPIPLSFATLIIYLAAGALGWKYGVLSVVLYVALGAVGVPVFSNFEGGFHKIAGVTGGFIIGYIPCALITGFFVEVFREKLWAYASGMVVGTFLLYACGTAWFMLQTNSSLAVSLALCVTPFLIGDAGKIVAACVIAPQLRTALERLRPRGV